MSATTDTESARRHGKSAAAFRTISEVADDLDVPPHVLRFWETKFSQVRPMKRGGGRRYYRPEDVALLRRIRELLYSDGYTIKGVQRLLKDGTGRSSVAEDAVGEAGPTPALDLAPPPVRQPAELAVPAPRPIATAPEKSDVMSAEKRDELEAILKELESLKRSLDDARGA